MRVDENSLDGPSLLSFSTSAVCYLRCHLFVITPNTAYLCKAAQHMPFHKEETKLQGLQIRTLLAMRLSADFPIHILKADLSVQKVL